MDASRWERLTEDLVLMCGATLSQYFIQFSVGGQGCVPSLFFGLEANPWWR